MKEHDNRIPKNLQAIQEEKLRLRGRSKNTKNAISHEKRLNSKTGKCDRMQRGIRDSININVGNSKGGLVTLIDNTYTTHTPLENSISHNEVINFFPEKVKAGIDENDNDIYLPFLLPAWRYLNEKTKPYFYQLALSELEVKSNHEYRVIPFVFNESTALTAAFNKQNKKRVDFVRDRLQKAITAALSRPKENPILFWFAFETAFKGQPHYQGSILLKPSELKQARKAFYKINRLMTPREKHGALRFGGSRRSQAIKKHGTVWADLNWADYNLKERAITRREYNNLNDITGTTRHLKNATKDYYEYLRSDFKLTT